MLSPGQVIDGIITRGTALGRRRPLEGMALLIGAVELADRHDLQAQGMRAFNNLAVVRSFDVQRVEQSQIEEFVARARRLGAAAWLNRALVNAALVYIDFGDLATAEEMLDEVETYELNDLEAAQVRMARAQVAAIRDGTPEQLAEYWAAASVFDDSTDAQMQGMSHSVKAGVKALEGDFAASLEHALLDPSSEGAIAAAVASLAMGDSDAIARARAFADGILIGRGRITSLVGLLLDAGSAAAAGDIATASSAFVEVLDMVDRVVGPVWVTAIRTFAHGMVGDAHPATLEAGQQALAWLREHEYRRWETVLEEFLPGETMSASETA